MYEKFFTSSVAGIDVISSSSSSISSYFASFEILSPAISIRSFNEAILFSCPKKAIGSQVRVFPNRPLTSRIEPSTCSGCSTKYLLYTSPFSSSARCIQSSSRSSTLSLFFRKIISLVTSVPATPLKVSFGSLIAPKNSDLAAR